MTLNNLSLSFSTLNLTLMYHLHFSSVWNNTCCKLVMDQNFGQHKSRKRKTNAQIPIRDTKNGEKCNQCEYTSSLASNLKRHLKTHSREKPNQCSRCVFASAQAGDLRRHSKTHSGEKSNKCNQCDYAPSQAI